MGTAKFFGWITAIGGLWEILSPFILGTSSSTGAMVDAIILGAFLVLFGLWVALSRWNSAVRTLSWINAVLGLWLVLAPFIIGYSSATGAMVNDIIVGGVVLVIEIWGALAARNGL